MIRILEEADAQEYAGLRRRALLEVPLAFASSPQDDFTGSLETVRVYLSRAPDSVVLGAFRPGLVGTVGLYRDPHFKARHKAHVWGMYVRPDLRSQGIATALIAAALTHARTLPGVSSVRLSVSSAAAAARRCYERSGFRVWGTEPDALRDGGRSVVEHHMVLGFDPEAD